ncbi:DUF5683 domain-containing protein [Cardinium endosymbiont of Nabis limbatus]|uniref:DUF5683 domain-containing protein n=1 Tax=Cardinium endosymbiont of Nabis limbatus TaxID=3066217 RepID=UPI003AF37C08
MKVHYRFFLMVMGFLHFTYLGQAKVTWPSRPIIRNVTNQSPSGLHFVRDDYNHLSSSKVDEAELLRKTMRTQALIQRAWISSMVFPGLGQVYNKDYWKVPCLYLGFALVGYRIYSEHQEMNRYKCISLKNQNDNDNEKLNPAYVDKRIKECARTRNLFIIIAAAWCLLNVFDAYAGGHDKTVNFKDDIQTNLTSKATNVLQAAPPTQSNR